MKKLFLSLAVTSALGLTGCLSDGDNAPVTHEEINISATRVVFDPGMGKLTVPTDILLGGTTDGTLMLPVANRDNYADPSAAISALDGWSTAMPFDFEFDGTFNENGDPIGIDGRSVTAVGSIRMYEAVMGADMSVEACATVPAGAVCTITGELSHGEDFTVVWANNKARVIPLKPLKPKTGYVVSITDNVVDEIGRSVAPSTTYYTLSKPIATDPIGGASEQALQGMINSQRGALAAAGVDVSTVIHSNSFTTQSVGDVLGVIKQMMLQPSLAPQLVAGPTGANAGQLLAQAGQVTPGSQSYMVATAADIYAGQVNLPYFSPVPTAAKPDAPLKGRWQATAVSPASIQIALGSGALTQDELIATLVGLGLNPAEVLADPRKLAGAIPYEAAPLALYNPNFDPTKAVHPETNPRGLDQGRHLTKFNPIPRPQNLPQVPLLMSVPNLAVANALRAAQQLPALEQPAEGWPIVIFQHGITGSKENFLAIAGTFAMFGHAAIAIDHPLHGERGFPGGINATTGKGSPTNYLNLASLLTARDNLRQSVSDLLGVRLSLSNGAANFGGAAINGNDVKFTGHSLGAMAGHNFVALANTTVGGDMAPIVDPLYKVKAGALGMPGVGIAPFLLESQSFGPLIGGMLSFQSFPKFAEFALEEATNSGVVPGSDEFMNKLGVYYTMYFNGVASAPEAAARDALLAQFQFAAQTVVDSGDPLNYMRRMVSSKTPVFLIEALGDKTIPNSTAHPLGGTEPMIRLLGLASIKGPAQSTDGKPVTGAARYLKGGHAGLLSPADDAATTANQQTAIAAWFGTGMLLLNVDPTLVKQ